MPDLHSVFLFLSVVGGGVAVLQSLASLMGVGSDHDTDSGAIEAVHHAVADSESATALSVFNFRSIRAIAAGIGFTGLGGLLALRQFGPGIAIVLALLLGLTIYLLVAYVMRGFVRLEADHSIHPLRAVGLDAVVSLPIPAPGGGPGKVTLIVAGRRVEWPAVQSDAGQIGSAIVTGSPVQVVDAADDTTLTVVAVSQRT